MLRGLGSRWRPSREPLPSLFDRHPDALTGSRHARGIQIVPLDAIMGTARHPTQNTADFLPLQQLRGPNWEARWQRITDATRRLEVLPPVELLQVGDEYWVVDGHNRIAAALQNGAAAVDADVTELLAAGAAEGHPPPSLTAYLDTDEVRQAGEGRFSRTAGLRKPPQTRDELARGADAWEADAPDEEPPVADTEA